MIFTFNSSYLLSTQGLLTSTSRFQLLDRFGNKGKSAKFARLIQVLHRYVVPNNSESEIDVLLDELQDYSEDALDDYLSAIELNLDIFKRNIQEYLRFRRTDKFQELLESNFPYLWYFENDDYENIFHFIVRNDMLECIILFCQWVQRNSAFRNMDAINQCNRYGDSALLIAAAELKINTLKVILDANVTDINLHIVNSKGRNFFLVFLKSLKRRWDENRRSKSYHGPTHQQVIELITSLAKRMNIANTNSARYVRFLENEDTHGFNTIDVCLSLQSFSILSYLISSSGISPLQNEHTFSFARYLKQSILMNNAETVSFFGDLYSKHSTYIKYSKAESKAASSVHEWNYVDFLTYAIEHEKTISLHSLLAIESFEAALNRIDKNSWTPLSLAIWKISSHSSSHSSEGNEISSPSSLSHSRRAFFDIHVLRTLISRCADAFLSPPFKLIEATRLKIHPSRKFFNDSYTASLIKYDNYFACICQIGNIDALRLLLIPSSHQPSSLASRVIDSTQTSDYYSCISHNIAAPMRSDLEWSDVLAGQISEGR